MLLCNNHIWSFSDYEILLCIAEQCFIYSIYLYKIDIWKKKSLQGQIIWFRFQTFLRTIYFTKTICNETFCQLCTFQNMSDHNHCNDTSFQEKQLSRTATDTLNNKFAPYLVSRGYSFHILGVSFCKGT